MNTGFSTMRPFGCAAVLMLAISAAATAQQRQLYQWNGKVDQTVELTMSGRNLSASNVGPAEPGQKTANVMAGIPREDGVVTAKLVSGRGTVEVIRQPTAANGYTAIVRVNDPAGGSGSYSINAFWQPASAGEVASPIERVRGDAVNGTALTWSGDVDDNMEITIRPGGVTYKTLSGKAPRKTESAFTAMPERATRIAVNQIEGRGDATVIQQPTAENGYTAVVRVRDPKNGYSHYKLEVTWR